MVVLEDPTAALGEVMDLEREAAGLNDPVVPVTATTLWWTPWPWVVVLSIHENRLE